VPFASPLPGASEDLRPRHLGCLRRAAALRAPRPRLCRARHFPRDLRARRRSRAHHFLRDLHALRLNRARHSRRALSFRPPDGLARSHPRRVWTPHRGRHPLPRPPPSSPALRGPGPRPCHPPQAAAMACSRHHRPPCTAASSARPGGGRVWARRRRVPTHPHGEGRRPRTAASWVPRPRLRTDQMQEQIPVTMEAMMALALTRETSCMARTSMRWRL